MLLVRIGVGLALGYVVVLVLARRSREGLALPALRAPLTDPPRVGVANGEKIGLVIGDGTRLAGWYLPTFTVVAQHCGGYLRRDPSSRGGADPRVAVHQCDRHGTTRVPHLPGVHRPPLTRQPRPDEAGALPGAVVPRDRGSARPARDGDAGRRRGPGPGRARAAPGLGA